MVLAVLASIALLAFCLFLLMRIQELSDRIQRIEEIIYSKSQEKIPKAEKTKPIETSPPVSVPEKKQAIETQEKKAEFAYTSASANKEISKPVVPTKLKQEKSEAWQKFETAFAQNWTGILGSIILVMGVGFLGIYAALQMNAFFRFLLVLSIGAGLYAASIYLVRKEFWRQVSYWIKSASGAVTLFACIGSVSIPGMHWIENQYLGLLLILAGIGVNLAFAWQAAGQRFASLHIILSLVSLIILPKSSIVFGIIVIVSLFSSLLSYRAKWEFHLTLTVASYLIANLIYGNSLNSGESGSDPSTMRIIGLFGTGAVGIASLLVHYRRVYTTSKFEITPFVTHLVVWATMAIGFLQYSTGSKWNVLILGIASVPTYFLARRAKSFGIRWLHLTDTLVSLLIASLSIIYLFRWEMDPVLINIILSLLLTVFFLVSWEEKDNVLGKIGAALLHLSWAGYLIISLLCFEKESIYWYLVATLLTLGISIVPQAYDSLRFKDRKNSIDDIYNFSEKEKLSPSGLWTGLLAALLCYQISSIEHSEIFASFLFILLLIFRQKFQWNGIAIGLIPFIIALHILVIHRGSDKEGFDFLRIDLPLVVAILLLIPLSKRIYSNGESAYYSKLGVILFSLHLITHTFTIGSELSPFLPGILVLLYSLLYLDTYKLISNQGGNWKGTWKDSIYSAKGAIGILAFGFVALFLIIHAVVHLQSEFIIGWFKIRFLVQIFAIACFLYWANSKPAKEESSSLWNKLPPLFWELSIVFGVIAISFEVPNVWLPVAWILYAWLLEFLSWKFSEELSRLRLYALLLFWVSCVHTAFLSSSNTTPSNFWADQEWVGGLVGVFGQVSYLVRAYSYTPQTIKAEPGFVEKIQVRSDKLWSLKNVFVFYPVFGSIALFLYWSFEHSILTLLWMIEIFVVFIIGLKLRESQFRLVSLSAMVICLIRLIFWDLKQSSTITRAIVFLAAGSILILMNTIYNKFKNSEKESKNGT
ncbi:hypothetical protein CH360_08860 [Leptospira perolatii]|nr:hypothetical protein CH360_08860 [Leptospira perolatii]